MMRIDLHVHAMERSGCSKAPEQAMIESAIANGLDAIAFTDHDRLVPIDRLAAMNDRYRPFQVFTGIEVTVEGEHVVVIGLHDELLEDMGWNYAELHAFVRERGGATILAHPFRYSDDIQIPIDKYPPDAIEVHSMNTGVCDEKKIRAVAAQIGCHVVCNSDAHAPEEVGVYHNRLHTPANTDIELVQALKSGAFEEASLPDRVAAINATVEEREARIRQMIEAGCDRDHYRRMTGCWEGHFDRVARGKSYRI